MKEEPVYYTMELVRKPGPSMEKLMAIRFSLREQGFSRNEILTEISGFAGETKLPTDYLKRMLDLGYIIEDMKDGKPHYKVNMEKIR